MVDFASPLGGGGNFIHLSKTGAQQPTNGRRAYGADDERPLPLSSSGHNGPLAHGHRQIDSGTNTTYQLLSSACPEPETRARN